MDPKIEPLMAQFGAAVNDAQELEFCLELIHALLDQTVETGEVLPEASWLYGAKSSAGLGRLVKVLRQRIALPESISEELDAAIKTRNHLVHAYFKSADRLVATMTRSGTEQLILELRDIRATLSRATASADGILDELLARYHLNVAALKERAQEMYSAAQLEEFHGTRH